MASSIMHVAISTGVLREFPDIERNRFLLGSMLPDAAGPGNGHRKINVCDGAKKTYDLPGFRAQFAEQLKNDPLYLGYYLHLVQDLVFRCYVYRIHHWNPMPEGNRERRSPTVTSSTGTGSLRTSRCLMESRRSRCLGTSALT